MRARFHLIAGAAGLAVAAAVAALLARPARASDDVERAPEGQDVAPEVNGGTPVAAGTWQDAAALYIDGELICSGTLIAPNLVITARHCLVDPIDTVIVDSVVLGVGEEIAALRRFTHPDLDVGVVVLTQDATVAPRLIASGCVVQQDGENGADVAIVGWGATDPDAEDFPGLLMEAMTTIDDVSCTGPQSEDHGCRFPNGELIAGGDGIDSCNGDSGGPLYLLTERGDFLIGVTSRALRDATQPCGEGGIYIRADAPMPWIEQVTGVVLPQPSCNVPPVPAAVVLEVEVEAGETVEVEIDAFDPDGAGALSFTIGATPGHGEAEVGEDGMLTFTAAADFEGQDSMTVVIADSGAPPATTSVVVNITIVPNEGCDGCASGGGGAAGTAWLAAAVAALVWPRRRRLR